MHTSQTEKKKTNFDAFGNKPDAQSSHVVHGLMLIGLLDYTGSLIGSQTGQIHHSQQFGPHQKKKLF
jgi:hypothetical protein